MEGIFGEVVFIVGYWGLGKLIVFYDDNYIFIDGFIDVAFIEDVSKCFEVYGWYVFYVEDGNIDLVAIVKVIEEVKVVIDKFFMIKVIIIIGYGVFNKFDIVGIYGVVLGIDEVVVICKNLGWDYVFFEVFQEVLDYICKVIEWGVSYEVEWN